MSWSPVVRNLQPGRLVREFYRRHLSVQKNVSSPSPLLFQTVLLDNIFQTYFCVCLLFLPRVPSSHVGTCQSELELNSSLIEPKFVFYKIDLRFEVPNFHAWKSIICTEEEQTTASRSVTLGYMSCTPCVILLNQAKFVAVLRSTSAGEETADRRQERGNSYQWQVHSETKCITAT
jgi:hypothetical protein